MEVFLDTFIISHTWKVNALMKDPINLDRVHVHFMMPYLPSICF